MPDKKSYPIRSMYMAPPGHVLMEFDFSQAETWIVAYLANEDRMKYSLQNGDIHTDTASLIFGTPANDVTTIERFLGKKGNHSLSYGSTHYRLTQSINKESDQPPYVTVTNAESKVIFDGWHSAYRIEDWWGEIQRLLDVCQKTLTTPYGGRRTFYAPWGKDLFKEAYAYIPQRTVAEHCQGRVHPELGIRGGMRGVYLNFVRKGYIKLVQQGHDSIIVEAPERNHTEFIPQIIQLMRRPIVVNGEEFIIPVDAKVGERWGELTEWQEG